MKQISFSLVHYVLILVASAWASTACHSPRPAANTPANTIAADTPSVQKAVAPKDSVKTKIEDEPSQFFD